ncbi:MAG: hypothetical protein KBS66_07870 [Eubacterium sp.]|nr:hypothetical protein [Candidatus Colimonas fimequi]
MLTIELPQDESFDQSKGEFVYFDEMTVKMEHSLVSLSEWERHYKKAFLTDEDKTPEETIYYIKCMALEEISMRDASRIYRNPKTLKQVFDYINDPACATTINEKKEKKGRDIITAEILYYDLIALQIPFEVQYWHLNRLLTLIKVCSIKNEPPKKTSMNERYSRQKAINEMNRAKFGM